MSSESVNNSAELTLGINTKPAETAIGELQTKLNGLVENLDKLNKAAGVQHVVSPEAEQQVKTLVATIKVLEKELDDLKKKGVADLAKGVQSSLKGYASTLKLDTLIPKAAERKKVTDLFGAMGQEAMNDFALGITKANRGKVNQVLQLLAKDTATSLAGVRRIIAEATDLARRSPQTALAEYGSMILDKNFQKMVDDQAKSIADFAKASADADEHLKTQRKNMGAVYKEAKTLATGYTALGQKIQGASALVKKFGREATQSFLGKSGDAFLIDKIPDLSKYKTLAQEQYTISRSIRESEWARLKDQAQFGRSAKEQVTALEQQLRLVRRINDERRAGKTIEDLAAVHGAAPVRNALKSDSYSEASIAMQIAHLEALQENEERAAAAGRAFAARVAAAEKALNASKNSEERKMLRDHLRNLELERKQNAERTLWSVATEEQRLRAALRAAAAIASYSPTNKIDSGTLSGLSGTSLAAQMAVSEGGVAGLSAKLEALQENEERAAAAGRAFAARVAAAEKALNASKNSEERKMLRDHLRNLELERKQNAERTLWSVATEEQRLRAALRAAAAIASYSPTNKIDSGTLSGLSGTSLAAQMAVSEGGVAGLSAKLEALGKLTKATRDQTKAQDDDTKTAALAAKRVGELTAAWAALDEAGRLRIAKKTATNMANGGDPTKLKGLAGSALAIDYVKEKNGLDGVNASLLALKTAAKNWDLGSLSLFGTIQDSLVNANNLKKAQLATGNEIVAMTRRQNAEQKESEAIATRIHDRSLAARVKDEQWRSLSKQSFSADEKEQIAALNRRLAIVKSIGEEYRAGASLRSISEKYGSAAVGDVAGQKFKGSRVFGLTEADIKAEIDQIKQAAVDRATAEESANRLRSQRDAEYLRDARAAIAKHFAAEKALREKNAADDKAHLARSIAEREMQKDQAHQKELRAERIQAVNLANARYNSDFGGDRKRALTNQRNIVQGVTTSISAGLSPREIVGKFGSDAYRDVIQQTVSTAALNKALADLNTTTKTLGTSHSTLANHVKNSSDHLVNWNKVGHESHSLARGLAGSMNALWLTWGSTVPLVAGAALGSSFVQAAKQGSEFAYQLTFVKALSDESAGAIERLSESSLNLARSGLFGPTEVASGYRILAQAGVSAAAALSVMPSVLNLATVGEMGMADAAKTLVGVMNAFSLSTQSASHVGDVFAKAAAVSQTSVSDMTEAMKTASVVGEQYGASIEDTATALTLLAKVNITGTAAGTSLRNMLKELYSPTEQAAKVLKNLGVETKDSLGNLKDFPSIIYDLKDKLKDFDRGSQVNILQKLFGERGAKEAISMLALTREQWDALNGSISQSEGFIRGVAAELEMTAKGRFTQALNSLKSNIVEAFKSSEGAMQEFATSLQSLADAPELREGLKSLVSLMTNLATTLVDLGPVILRVAEAWVAWKGVSLVVAGLSGLGGALTAAGVSMAAFGAAQAAFIGPQLAGAAGSLAKLQTGLLGVSAAAGAAGGSAALGGFASVVRLLLGPVGLAVTAIGGVAYGLYKLAEATPGSVNGMATFDAALDRQIKKLNEENSALAEQIRLKRLAAGAGTEDLDVVEKKKNDLKSKIASAQTKVFSLQEGKEKTQARADLASLSNQLSFLEGKARTAYTAQATNVQLGISSAIVDFEKAAGDLEVAAAKQGKAVTTGALRRAVASVKNDISSFSKPSEQRAYLDFLNKTLDDARSAMLGAGGTKTYDEGKEKSTASKVSSEAYQAEIAKHDGFLKTIAERERDQNNELERLRNEDLVSFREFYDRKLEIANVADLASLAEVAAKRDAADLKGDLSQVEKLNAELRILVSRLNGGNAAAFGKLETDEIDKATKAWNKLNVAMKGEVSSVGRDSQYELAKRTADEQQLVTLEIDRQVEAFARQKQEATDATYARVAGEQAHKDAIVAVNVEVENYRQALIAAAEANRVHNSNWVNGATEAWKAWKDSANNAAKITKESFTRVFQKVDEVFLDFIRTGKLNFKSLGQTIKDEVIKLLYELTVKKFVIGITGDFSNLALALGGTALKSILGVSGGGGSTSGGGTNYTGLASNASTAYSLYGGAKAAYAAYQGTAAGLSASETGAATWAYLQSGDFGTALGVALKGALGTEASTATTAASLEAYYAAQGLEASTMGVATEAGLGGAAGLSWASALFAIPFIAKFFNDRSRPAPLEFTGLAVDGQYNGKTFDGSLATNYMQGGSYWDQRMPLTSDAAIVAQNYQNLKPPVIEIANPAYADWQRAYQEAGFQNQIGDNAYLNGEVRVDAPSKISGYDEGYTPAPYSTDPTVLGNIDAAIEAAFNAPKSAMKKVAELFGDAELATQIDAFTAKISVSGQTIGEILGKIGAQVTTNLGQAFLPAVEAARVQGAALRTGLETAIANATTAGDTEAVNTLKAQMEAMGIAAGETWNQTFERVLKETDAVSKAMDLLGVSLKDIGDANKVLTLSDNLVTLFGGVDALNTSINAYYGNFYTEAEKQERLWKGMEATFASLNITTPKTREEFRSIVDGLDLTTVNGQGTFKVLMDVQGAFAQLVPAMEAAAAAVTEVAVTADQLRSAKSTLMEYFNVDQQRMVLTGEIASAAQENGVNLDGQSLTNLGNATRQQFAHYVQTVANEGTEASRRMLVALAAIAPAFEDLVALAEAAAAADLQAAIDVTQSAIDALTGQYGDVATALLEINPPAKTLVESWRDNKTALEALQGTFDQFFGVTIPDAAATIQSLLTQLSAFEGGAETARSNADNARLQGMTPTERAAFWRNQEATLWQGLGNSTDKAGTISKIMDAYANTRAAELDALTGEQTKLNDAQKTGIQDQIDAWKTTLSVIEQSKRLVEDIDKTLAGLAYSDLSNLGYTDQLGAASSSYSNTLSKAAAGDTNAMGNLTSIARDYLTEAQTYFGGATLDYSNVYDKVTGDLRGLGMGLNTDGTGAQSEIDRLTASLSRIPDDLKAAFDTQTADGYERIATALDAGTQYSTARLDEQRAQLQTQIDQQKVVIANQEAQIRQQADNHAALMERLAEQNARLAALESNSNLTVAA